MAKRPLYGAARVKRVPLELRYARWLARTRYRVTQPPISNNGLMDLIGHEAIVLSPYWDSVHVLTWGVGHTRAAGAPDPATLWGELATIPQVIGVLQADVANRYEPGVNAAFTRPLSQPEKDAAVSFHYSTGAIGTATWVKRFNAGDMVGARQAFMEWDQPASIIPRRTAECHLFFDGVYANTAGVAELIPASGTGVLQWSQAKDVSIAAWLTKRRAA